MNKQEEKWMSVGKGELSPIENSVTRGRSSKGKPYNSLPIDGNGNIMPNFPLKIKRLLQNMPQSPPAIIDFPDSWNKVVRNSSGKADINIELLLHDFSFKNPSIIAKQKVVIDKDERQKVEILNYPYNCIALLKIEYGNSIRFGTGFFISERCVVTAGHNVFDNGLWANSISVIPGAYLGEYPANWGLSISEDLHSVKGWVRDRDFGYDYGAIILPDNTLHKKLRGTMGYEAYDPDQVREVELSGYPLDKTINLYFVKGRIDRVDANRLYYTMSTNGGQSGSPVFYRDGQKCIVVGVHTGANLRETENHAISVNDNVMRRWKEWSTINS